MSFDEYFNVDEEILSILQNQPLEFVKKVLDKRIVGESVNKIALFLSKLTYLFDNPLHEIIQGLSGVGKTYLALGVLDVFPEEDVFKFSRITPTWTDYAGARAQSQASEDLQKDGIRGGGLMSNARTRASLITYQPTNHSHNPTATPPIAKVMK